MKLKQLIFVIPRFIKVKVLKHDYTVLIYDYSGGPRFRQFVRENSEHTIAYMVPIDGNEIMLVLYD